MSDIGEAVIKMNNKVSNFTNSELLDVWKAAISEYAKPELGYGILTWDDWTGCLYSEISKRDLNALQ